MPSTRAVSAQKDAGALLSNLSGIGAMLTCVAAAAESKGADMPTIAEALYLISDLHHVATNTFQADYHG